MNPPDTVAGRLRFLRELAPHLSARELDRLAGKREGHASLIEANPDADPQGSTLAAYARKLGCTLDWLVRGVGEAPTPETVRASVELARAQRSAETTPHTASDFIVTPATPRNAPASPASPLADSECPPREITVVRDAEWSQERTSVTGVGV